MDMALSAMAQPSFCRFSVQSRNTPRNWCTFLCLWSRSFCGYSLMWWWFCRHWCARRTCFPKTALTCETLQCSPSPHSFSARFPHGIRLTAALHSLKWHWMCLHRFWKTFGIVRCLKSVESNLYTLDFVAVDFCQKGVGQNSAVGDDAGREWNRLRI